EPPQTYSANRNHREDPESVVFDPTAPALPARNQRHRECPTSPQPLNDGSLGDLVQHAACTVERRCLKAPQHRGPDEPATPELAAVEMGISDVLRPKPLLLEQVSLGLAEQGLHHMVNVVIPKLGFSRFEHFGRRDHPREPGGLVLVA